MDRLPSPPRALVVAALALSAGALGALPACGGHATTSPPKTPEAHATSGATDHADSADSARDETKTIKIEYAFDHDSATKDFDKSFTDGFEKKGLSVDETLAAHAHFDVKDAKVTGTVTYAKSGGHFTIVAADLVTSGRYEADLQLDVDVQVKGDAKNAKIGDWDKTLIAGKTVPIAKNVMAASIPITGAGSLALEAHFDLSAACDLQVEGPVHATTGVGVAGSVRLATKYARAGFDAPDGKKAKFKFESPAPAFELAAKPYLSVDGKGQRVKGRCSLQPTAVLVVDDAVGAKLVVEPFVDLDAKRASAREKWQLDAQAGVSVNAATDLDVVGRLVRKAKEYPLFEVLLTKPGDEMGAPVRPQQATGAAPKTERPGKVEMASVLGDALAAPASRPTRGKAKPQASASRATRP